MARPTRCRRICQVPKSNRFLSETNQNNESVSKTNKMSEDLPGAKIK